MTTPSMHSVDDIDDFFDQIWKDLTRDQSIIQERLGFVNQKQNPQVLLWLFHASLYNYVMKKDDANKQVIPSVQLIQQFSLQFQEILKIIPMKKQKQWYAKLGDVSQCYAQLCINGKKPIKGIATLLQAINKVQDSADQYTNVHPHFVKLCQFSGCLQHALRIIDHPVIRFKSGLENVKSNANGDDDEKLTNDQKNEKAAGKMQKDNKNNQNEGRLNREIFKQQGMKQDHVSYMIKYLYRRGQVFQSLNRYEDAYLSYTKALSIPHASQGNEILKELSQSYAKALLISKILQIQNCCATIDSVTVPEKRTAISLPHLLHFTHQQTLQGLKRQCGPYLQLIHALENDTKMYLGMNVSNDSSNYQMDEDDAGFDDDANGSGVKQDSNKSKVESIVSNNAENLFSPNGDMDLIREIIAHKDIVSKMAYLKNVYVQYPLSKMFEDIKNAMQTSVLTDEGMTNTIYKMLSTSNLSASVQLNEKDATVKFIDDEVQQSCAVVPRKQQEQAAEKQHLHMGKLVHGIESQNIRIVELMSMVREKTNEIKLSQDYAKAQVKLQAGKGELDMDTQMQIEQMQQMDDERATQ